MRSEAITMSLLRAASRELAILRTEESVGGQNLAPRTHVAASAIERRSARASGMHCNPRPRAIRPTFAVVETVSAVAARWLRDHIEPRRSPKTIANYRTALGHLARLVDDAALDSLTQPDIAAALEQISEGSRAAVFSAWSSCLRWVGRADLLAGIERPSSRRREAVLDVEDLQHFLAGLGMATACRWARKTYVDAILLAMLVPFREGEICRLQRQHVDLGSRIATLHRHKTQRFVGTRRVPLGKLGASILAGRPDGPYFFAPTRASGIPHIRPESLSRACRRILDRYAEIAGRPWAPDTCFHTLRHSWTSHALTMGVNAENVRQICGWSSTWVQDRYAHILSDAGQEIDRVQDRLTKGLQMQLSMGVS